MFQTIAQLIRNESGTTAIEYGLIAVLISISAVSALQAMSGSVGGLFNLAKTILTNVVAGA